MVAPTPANKRNSTSHDRKFDSIADSVTNRQSRQETHITANMPPKQKVARAPQENIQLGPQVREVRAQQTLEIATTWTDSSAG